MLTQKQIDARRDVSNRFDAYHRGQDARRGRWGTTKLTSSQRSEIVMRKQDGESVQSLALEYGISAGYIRSFS